MGEIRIIVFEMSTFPKTTAPRFCFTHTGNEAERLLDLPKVIGIPVRTLPHFPSVL